MDEYLEEQLIKECDEIVRRMELEDRSSEAYEKLQKALRTNLQILREEKPKKWWERVLDYRDIIGSGLTFAGIVWITKHEQFEVITSRAFNLIRFK